MKFEVIKRSHVKRNVLIGVIVVLVLSAVILTFTKAKYRVTQSIPLVSGTINYSAADLNLVAMYLNQGGALPEGQTDLAPKFGYTLNEEQSTCEVNDSIIEDAKFTYENGMLGFYNLNRKGTKCTVYFDLIPDNENPVINDVAKVINDNSITVTVNATDNIGIYYYYFQLNDEEEIRLETPTYTFENLIKDQIYTINIRVEDAAGNTEEYIEEVTAGYSAKNVILNNYNTILTRNDFSTIITETTTGTIYKSLNESQYDDYGEIYYFAGNPEDNWLKFGGFWWRIIRINGNGSIRIIYQGTSANIEGNGIKIGDNYFNSQSNNNMYVGFKYTNGEVHGYGTNSTILGSNTDNSTNTLNGWYRRNLINYTDYIDGNAGFCGDRTIYSGSGINTDITYYAAYNRMTTHIPSLRCENDLDLFTIIGSNKGNKSLTYPIGLITVDEAMFAGGTSENNQQYYLYPGTSTSYWTMSPAGYYSSSAYVYVIGWMGHLYASMADINFNNAIRPVINLKADVQITGSGTTTDPFVVVS